MGVGLSDMAKEEEGGRGATTRKGSWSARTRFHSIEANPRIKPVISRS